MREEEKKQSSQGVKRFLKKRWAYPAIYIASAALILTGVLWFQNSSTNDAIDSEKFNYENASDLPGNEFGESVEVNRSMENVVLPLMEQDRAKSVIQTKFYDDSAKAEDQEAALVVYQNQYHPNTGIDIAVKESEAFDVVAALSGTVTRIQEDALLGNVIEIDHEDGIVTQYQSIKDMKVKVGDSVKQGQALATAGTSLINEEAGVHVHFEIRKDGMPVNPESFLNKPLSTLQEIGITEENPTEATEEDTTGDSGVSEEEPVEDQMDSTENKETPTMEETPAKEETPAEEKTPAKDEKGSTEEKSPSDEKGTDQKQDEQTNNMQNKNA